MPACPLSRSDEEEGGAGASEDEDDDVDDQGELVSVWVGERGLWLYGWMALVQGRVMVVVLAGCCCCAAATAYLVHVVLAAAMQHLVVACPSHLPHQPSPSATSTPRHLPQADLIGNGKETAKDGKMRLLLHRQWAEAQDDKELQQVMRGLKNGFRRRRGAGFLDDEVG